MRHYDVIISEMTGPPSSIETKANLATRHIEASVTQLSIMIVSKRLDRNVRYLCTTMVTRIVGRISPEERAAAGEVDSTHDDRPPNPTTLNRISLQTGMESSQRDSCSQAVLSESLGAPSDSDTGLKILFLGWNPTS